MKLVTILAATKDGDIIILIHTSVKLVTPLLFFLLFDFEYFNPHEREARDAPTVKALRLHNILIHTSVKLVTETASIIWDNCPILIHTSVKLVTPVINAWHLFGVNFNPHEREARDGIRFLTIKSHIILIHTSVKLVTQPLITTAKKGLF